MARIAGIDIPREKRVEIALTYIFGIGLPTSQKLALSEHQPDTRVRDLTEDRSIACARSSTVVTGGRRPRREVALNIKRLIEIGRIAGCATDATCRCAASGYRQCLTSWTEEDGRRAAKKVRAPTGPMAERKRAVKQRRRKNVPWGHVLRRRSTPSSRSRT